MRVRYQTNHSFQIEGEVIGYPFVKPNSNHAWFLIKTDEGTFKEVKCEDCFEIRDCSKKSFDSSVIKIEKIIK